MVTAGPVGSAMVDVYKEPINNSSSLVLKGLQTGVGRISPIKHVQALESLFASPVQRDAK